jgi:hypothetical protein
MPGIFLYRPYQQRSRMEAADVPAAAKFGGERRCPLAYTISIAMVFLTTCE